MKRLGLSLLTLVVAGAVALSAADESATITIDYPQDGSIFPPDIAAPTFLWRDANDGTDLWRIEVKFNDGSDSIRVESRGELMKVGEIDRRALSDTNELPKLTPEQAVSHTWQPDDATWAAIKERSAGRKATVTITGFRSDARESAVSTASVGIETSLDPVGAPIFYRDVPLMPSEVEKGVIKPLAKDAVPLIAWRLRDIANSAAA